MRKLFIATILMLTSLNSHAQSSNYDVNGDGSVNVTDVMLIVNAILKISNPDDNHPSTGEQTPTQSYLACPDDHHPHLIDLGLPSGTKWACCNVDTDHPEKQSPTNYGGYYAWGETATKATYDWSSYIHCDGIQSSCHPLGSNISNSQYDVANVKWGGLWQMPTKEQFEELMKNCTSTWTSLNGIDGRQFNGTNGGSIFLPAAGYHNGTDLYSNGFYGYYWTATQHGSYDDSAYNLHFNSESVDMFYYYRFRGRSIRPIIVLQE